MQDLEDLKKNINTSNDINYYRDDVLNLIARCESAEKELGEHRAMFDRYVNAEQELKALREQNPVAYIIEYDVEGVIEKSVECSNELSFSEWIHDDKAYPAIGSKPLYAAPVAQSRDSAEPVGYMDDTGDIIKASIFIQLGYDPKTTKYSIPVYAGHSEQPIANSATILALIAQRDELLAVLKNIVGIFGKSSIVSSELKDGIAGGNFAIAKAVQP